MEGNILQCKLCLPVVHRYVHTIPIITKTYEYRTGGWRLSPRNALIRIYSSRHWSRVTCIIRYLDHTFLHSFLCHLRDGIRVDDLMYIVLDYLDDPLMPSRECTSVYAKTDIPQEIKECPYLQQYSFEQRKHLPINYAKIAKQISPLQ